MYALVLYTGLVEPPVVPPSSINSRKPVSEQHDTSNFESDIGHIGHTSRWQIKLGSHAETVPHRDKFHAKDEPLDGRNTNVKPPRGRSANGDQSSQSSRAGSTISKVAKIKLAVIPPFKADKNKGTAASQASKQSHHRDSNKWVFSDETDKAGDFHSELVAVEGSRDIEELSNQLAMMTAKATAADSKLTQLQLNNTQLQLELDAANAQSASLR